MLIRRRKEGRERGKKGKEGQEGGKERTSGRKEREEGRLAWQDRHLGYGTEKMTARNPEIIYLFASSPSFPVCLH